MGTNNNTGHLELPSCMQANIGSPKKGSPSSKHIYIYIRELHIKVR